MTDTTTNWRPRTAWGIDPAGDPPPAALASRGARGATVKAATPPAGEGLVLAAALPVHETFVRRLTAPFASVAKAARVWPSLLDVQLPFPLESCICFYLNPRATPDGQVTALAVAARREDVAAALERWRAAGCDPVLVDHEGLALWTYSGREQPLARSDARLVAYLGADRTSFALGQGPDLQAALGLRIGAAALRDPGRGAEAARQLAQRVTPWLRAQRPGDPWNGLQTVWTGPGAADETLLGAVREALAAPADTAFHVPRDPATFLARAVALRAVEGGPLACRFRQGDLLHPLARRAAERVATRALVFAIAACLLLTALNAAWLGVLQRHRDVAQAELQALARDVAGTDRVPRGQEVMTAERARQDRLPLLEPLRQVFQPAPTRLLATLLQAAAAQGMTIETLALRPQSVVCAGTAADWAHCEALVAALGDAGWSAELERRDAGADERVHFAVKATR